MTEDGPAERKRCLRQRLLSRRRNLSADEVRRRSDAVCNRLFELGEVHRPPGLVLYAAIGGEVRVERIFHERRAAGGVCFLPVFDPSNHAYRIAEVADYQLDTVEGKFGIREPHPSRPCLTAAEMKTADITWLVPGVAFDGRGGRLGRGAGYYDRLMAGTAGVRVGVAYDWQLVPEVPRTPSDIDMNVIVTEQSINHCPTQ